MNQGKLEGTFDAAVREHAGSLFRYAYWLSRNRQKAEDIVQEALLRGWRAFEQVNDTGAVKSWLFTIVRNEFLRAIAKDARHLTDLNVDELEIPDERVSPFGMEMRDALMALPVSYAEPLALQLVGGFSCVEIAAMLQTTEGAVMTRLTRARQALKRLLLPSETNARKGEKS